MRPPHSAPQIGVAFLFSGAAVVAGRGRLNLSAPRLAVASGVALDRLAAIEDGAVDPTFGEGIALSRALGVPGATLVARQRVRVVVE